MLGYVSYDKRCISGAVSWRVFTVGLHAAGPSRRPPLDLPGSKAALAAQRHEPAGHDRNLRVTAIAPGGYDAEESQNMPPRATPSPEAAGVFL